MTVSLKNRKKGLMYNAYFTVMISAFLVIFFVFYPSVCLSFSLSPSFPTPPPPSSSPPPPSVRTNCSQKPQHSKHSTQPRALSLSLSLALCRSLTHTHRNPHASHWVSLSLTVTCRNLHVSRSFSPSAWGVNETKFTGNKIIELKRKPNTLVDPVRVLGII